MSLATPTFGGLGSRVALRTLILFCLSAVVPIVIFALLADRVVSDKLTRQANERLAQTSKSYGLLLFDRLIQTQTAMDDVAALALSHQIDVASLAAYRSDRFRIVQAQTSPAQLASPPSSERDAVRMATIEVHKSGGRDVISLHLTRQLGPTMISLTAELADDHFWNADAVLMPGAAICVESLAVQLRRCLAQEQSAPGVQLAASWSLFLGRQLGGATWIITTRQSQSDALQALRSFETTFPIVSLVAILLALLLAMVQIRRSHGPLALLARAATQVARRQFHHRVEINTQDEYQHLGRAFNVMSVALSRQFSLLRALSRIDRMILTDPEPELVFRRVLPSLFRHLRSRSIALVITDAAGTDRTAWVVSKDATAIAQIHMPMALEALLGTVDKAQLSGLHCLEQHREVFGTPVEFGGKLRGALIFDDPTAGRGTRLRAAKAFARRFAIAMGNAERRLSLIRQAYYDELTSLPNRRLFKERLEHELLLASGSGRRLALIYIDLDRFKDVNDSLGHSAGDALLIAVCDRLKATIRETDTLARMGGDEFVLIASDIDREPAHLVAGRLQSSLAEPIILEGTRCFVQASIGLTLYPEDGGTVEALLRNADIAMYKSKSQGRGSVTYFEEQMNRDAQQRLRVEQRLRHAVQNNALTLCYQPKVDLADGAIHGVEALARWTDAELGPVSPGVFIPIAEECGLIEVLGRWAMYEACMAFQRQAQAGVHLGHVSVNVSMRQLNSDAFVNDVRTIIAQTGMVPATLELELTESAVASDPQQALELLAELRSIGVRTSIDDFGTGYSSMSALAVLPADTLKIDRSFVVNCASDSAAQSVVAAIVSMAHALGKKTVAEGVETVEQLRSLRFAGCDYIQGYLISKPLQEAALAELASQSSRWEQLMAPDAEMILRIAS